MDQFVSDVRVLIFVFGIFWFIRCGIKEYQKVRQKPNPGIFIFYALAIFFFEVELVLLLACLCSDYLIRANILCSNFSDYTYDICICAVLCMALSSFCFSGYVFIDAALNGDVSKEEKRKGKMYFFCGLYFVVVVIVTLVKWD